MKKITNLLSMVLLMLCMGLTSCDDILGQFDNPFGPLSISVNSIDLDADEMTLTVGDVGQLIATVGPENATDKTVTWTSSKESVATVDATGKVTAVAEGTATIKAKAGSISTTCIVTVKAATVAVTSVTLDKTELALTVGDADVQLNVTVTPANATNADVDWESSDLSVATVDGAGIVHAVADGTATITAKAGGKTATCTVTVKAPQGYAANEFNMASWNSTQEKVVFTKQAAMSATAVANSDAAVTWSAGWYTVSGNVTINGKVTLGANTYLILQDGATLTINGQLDCKTNSKNLYIFGQKKGDGKLNVTNNSGNAINSKAGYRIDIHGGEVTAEATGTGLFTGYLAVYGGKLTATSGGGNGIGFGNTIDVYGGEVVATSNATSDACYGIRSSGSNTNQILTVYGGKVTATGNGVSGMAGYGSGFSCYVQSGAGVMFYFSDNGTAWDAGTYYLAADAAPNNRYAKAE